MSRKPRPAKGKSGRILVRLPVSMHESLATEAKRERMSLNTLIVAKLGRPLAENGVK